MKIEIDCVQLQRELRANAYEKYKHLSLREEVKAVQEGLRQKGRWPFFEDEPEGSGPEARREEKDLNEARK
jgi:hypothetical protein